MRPHRILGVDPGTNFLGFAIIEALPNELFVLEMGVIHLRKYFSHAEKLLQIMNNIQLLITKYQPTQMAIEAPFYGKNIQSMLKLGRAQGVAIATALGHDVEIQEYSPKKIKLAITGNGNASKDQVAAMLEYLVSNKVQSVSFDATDALAVAVCHHFQKKSKGKSPANYKSWKAFLKANPDRLT
jgi:crossover junction endodeoxyribonuclease RuvC